jgi:protein-tyrosine-phosphatase
VAERLYSVLFVCTQNSARSIMSESLMNYWGKEQFRGFSAGSHPRGQVHPLTLELLSDLQLPTEGLRSKSWTEFARPGAQPLDFVFTVCDTAARELPPRWPGTPVTAHWGVDDPETIRALEVERWLAFSQTFKVLENRIKLFAGLPVATLSRGNLQAWADTIGRAAPEDGV